MNKAGCVLYKNLLGDGLFSAVVDLVPQLIERHIIQYSNGDVMVEGQWVLVENNTGKFDTNRNFTN